MSDKKQARKLSWLRKNKVILKKEKIRPSTVDRLYSFYHRNPLSTPRNLAYGYKGRLEKTIEKGAEAKLRTPKGTMTVKEYVKVKNQASAKRVREELSPSVSSVKFGHRFVSGKREDRFRYSFRNDEGIIVTDLNVDKVLKSLKKTDIPDLMEHVAVFYKLRNYLYKHRAIGALIIYATINTPDDPVPRPVKFVVDTEFESYLYDMIDALLTQDIFAHYKDAIVQLNYIDVFIRTRDVPTPIERI